MTIEVNLALDTVRVSRTVGIVNIEKLKLNITNVPICLQLTSEHCVIVFFLCSHLSASALCLIIRNFPSQNCTNHIATL